jgi:ketosteroid isomerase-like protein
MSQENVELARAAIEDWNRGERESSLRYFHPAVEWLPHRAATEGAYLGVAGIERFRDDTEETFEKFEMNCELLDLGERVLMWGTIHVRARQSGIETDIPVGGLFEFRDGKIARWEDFGSRQRALDAAGAQG